MNKIISLALIVVMIMTVFVACSKEISSGSSDDDFRYTAASDVTTDNVNSDESGENKTTSSNNTNNSSKHTSSKSENSSSKTNQNNSSSKISQSSNTQSESEEEKLPLGSNQPNRPNITPTVDAPTGVTLSSIKASQVPAITYGNITTAKKEQKYITKATDVVLPQYNDYVKTLLNATLFRHRITE